MNFCCCFFSTEQINRIYHWPPVQTEKSQTEGDNAGNEFPALSVDSGAEISRSATGADD